MKNETESASERRRDGVWGCDYADGGCGCTFLKHDGKVVVHACALGKDQHVVVSGVLHLNKMLHKYTAASASRTCAFRRADTICLQTKLECIRACIDTGCEYRVHLSLPDVRSNQTDPSA